MPTHDLDEFCLVWRTTSGGSEDLGHLAEVERAERCWCDDAQGFHVAGSMVNEAVDGSTRNAERLAGTDINGFSVDGPGHYSVETVDRLLVVVVAMGRGWQALRARYGDLEHRYTAVGVLAGEQEAYRELLDLDDLVGRVHAEV